jgi:tRNA A37 threonylcarbamoyladenosine dehydratase
MQQRLVFVDTAEVLLLCVLSFLALQWVNGEPVMTEAAFERTRLFFGDAAFARIRRAFVVVVGLGGVGSHAAGALARGGVRRLRLVDPDVVSWSSLNRHLCATPDDVGRPKADVMARFLAGVRPDLMLEISDHLLTDRDRGPVLEGPPDLVIEAVDDVPAKSALIAACLDKEIPVVSALGASSRSDPQLIRVGNLWQATVCPLGRRLRKNLRRLEIAEGPVTAVWSTEKPRAPEPPTDESRLSPGTHHLQPSLPTLPAMLGYAAANAALILISSGRDRDRGAEGRTN